MSHRPAEARRQKTEEDKITDTIDPTLIQATTNNAVVLMIVVAAMTMLMKQNNSCCLWDNVICGFCFWNNAIVLLLLSSEQCDLLLALDSLFEFRAARRGSGAAT